MGLHRAGFEVVGVDIKRQPRYPFAVVQADALRPPFRLADFDFIWASPPCQAHTALKTMHNAKQHDDLIPATRALLVASGKPWVMENVPGADTLNPHLILCGTMFNLGTGDAELRRHRLFELSFPLPALVPQCQHYWRSRVCGVYGGHGRARRRIRPETVTVAGDGNGRDYRRNPVRPATVGVYGGAGGASVRDGTQQFSTKERAEAMGIDWMTGDELSQAIPPAYSEFIGKMVRESCI
jgi:DNA (cytosine-5)-methyltransferase 1